MTAEDKALVQKRREAAEARAHVKVNRPESTHAMSKRARSQ